MVRRHGGSPPVTSDIAAFIKYACGELKLMQHTVAARFGINQGRVSEIMNGKRFANVTPSPKPPEGN